MNILTPAQLDVLAESGNISMGAAATALSHLLGHRVEITTPSVTYTTVADVRVSYPRPCVLVRVHYRQGLEGSNMFILSDRDAGMIANLMMGDADLPIPEPLDELYLSAMSEAMNQMMGSSATAMSEMLNRFIDITPPTVEYMDLGNPGSSIDGYDDEHEVIKISFNISIGQYIASSMVQLLPAQFAQKIVDDLLSELENGYTEAASPVSPESPVSPVSPESPESLASPVSPAALQPVVEDALGEIGNISMGSAATALSSLLDRRVTITAPRVSLTTMGKVKQMFPHPCVVVRVHYKAGFAGDNVMIIRDRDASAIAGTMMGDASHLETALDEIRLSAVSEAMNQMMGSAATALSQMFARTVDISPPETVYRNLSETDLNLSAGDEDDCVVQILFHMEVDGLLDSELVQLIPLPFAQSMAQELLAPMEPISPPADMAAAAPAQTAAQLPPPDIPAYALWEESYEESDKEFVALELIRDIPIQVTGLLGRRTLPLRELTKVTAGSVVELDCAADAPVDILANGKLVARGEVVTLKDRFGIKINEIIHPWQR